MQRNRLIFILILAFIIIEYGIIRYLEMDTFNLFNNKIKKLDIGNSGLIATSVGSNLYIGWADFINKGVVLASSTVTKFKIDNINGGNKMPLSRSIDAAGSYTYLVWVDDYFHPSKIMLSKNDGNSIETSIIRETKYVLDYPTIKVNGPVVYLAWIEYIDNNYRVLLKYSHDNADTFSDTIYISNSDHDAGSFSMDAEGSSLYIAWHEIIDGEHRVFFRYSHDNAKSFSEPILVSRDGEAGFPIVDAEGSNVYLAWIERYEDGRSIVLMKSYDAGKSFENVLTINARVTIHALDADGPLVCISWLESNDSINIACSIDGKNFVKNAIDANDVELYRLDVEGSNVYLAWIDTKESEELNIISSHDAGNTFGETFTIVKGDINKAGVVASGSNLYVIWSELSCINDCNRIETKVYVRASYDAGNTFGETFNLSLYA